MVDPQVRQVVLGYRAATADLRARVLRYIETTWVGLRSYRDADIERFIAAVVPVVAAGQQRVASLTDAYLAAIESATFGTRIRPVGIDTTKLTTEAIRGVPAAEVYRRPGVTVWTALSAGATLADAINRGRSRALDLAGTDLQLAKTHASRQILSAKPNVVGYRRVLEGPHSCGLCAVAATQRYHSDRLMPIHGNCDCGVQPIYADADPGQVIEPDSLDGIHEEIARRFGRSSEGARGIPGSALEYRDVLVEHQHGELGPLLGVKGQAFTGPADL